MARVDHSVLFAGVTVEEGANVRDSVIMPGAVIHRGAVVRRAIVAENAVVGAGAFVGEAEGNIAVIGQNVTPARRRPGNRRTAGGRNHLR